MCRHLSVNGARVFFAFIRSKWEDPKLSVYMTIADYTSNSDHSIQMSLRIGRGKKTPCKKILRVDIFHSLFCSCLLTQDSFAHHDWMFTRFFLSVFFLFLHKGGNPNARSDISKILNFNFWASKSVVHVPELHKIRQSPDREALKLWKGRSGSSTVKTNVLMPF